MTDDLLDPRGFLEVWYRGLSSPYGIVVRCTGDRYAATQLLYQARAKADRPELKKLKLICPQDDSSLIWVYNR